MFDSIQANAQRFNKRIPVRFLCAIFLATACIWFSQSSATTHAAMQIEGLVPEEFKQDPLSAKDREMVTKLSSSMTAFEWLGPLAPIAISPFCGLACLCAISQFGGDWLPVNGFVSDNPVLQNPYVLWAFVTLTLITSLPRLTKVSKPLAQAIDQLEAWSGIVAIVVIRFASSLEEPGSEQATALAVIPVLESGIFSFTADVLFSIAAMINIVVINTVKFFFEVSVWLMPFPFVDALLEAANKTVCATLMAIYVWSPAAATILNLLIFLGCFLAFRWINRRVTYMRNLLFDPAWAMIQKSYGIPSRNSLTVFPQTSFGPFSAKEKIQLVDAGDHWELRKDRLLLNSKIHSFQKESFKLKVARGLFANSIDFQSADGSTTFTFSRRFNDHLEQLADHIGGELIESSDLSSAKEILLGT